MVNIHTRLHSNIRSTHTNPIQYIRTRSFWSHQSRPAIFHSVLTQVEDAIPRPVPAPAFQLLVLCVLKSSVMKHHTDDALKYREIHFYISIQFKADANAIKVNMCILVCPSRHWPVQIQYIVVYE